MPWNTLANLATGQLVTETHMDNIREDIEFLAGLGVKGSASDNVDRTTTSTSFVDMTNMSVTITTYGNPVILVYTGTVSNPTAGGGVNLDFTVDGTRQGGASGLAQALGSLAYINTLIYPILTLAAGSHTFKLQWKTTNASYAAAAYGSSSTPTKLFVLGG